MKVFDIYKLESANSNCCYLIRDGLFWRAYEKSAMHFYTTIKSYKVTKKHFKGIRATMVYIGFPDKNLGQIMEKCGELGLTTDTDGEIIKISGFDTQHGLEQWKSQFEEIQGGVAEEMPEYGAANQDSMTRNSSKIEEKIRKFPLAGKTPVECQQFLYELQNQINGTL